MKRNAQPKPRPTWAQLFTMYRGPQATRLVWAQRDTRWDVYPQQEPVQLAAHNWEGWWLPCPDGTWYKSPVGFNVAGEAYTPDLRGEWVHDPIGVGDIKIWEYRRVTP